MVRYVSHSGGQCGGSDDARDVIWGSGPAGARTVPFLSHLASLVCPSVCPLTTSKRILTTLEHANLSSLHLWRPSKPSNYYSYSNTDNNQESKPTPEIPFSFAFSPYHQRCHHSLHLLHPECDLHLVIPASHNTHTHHLT